MEKTIKISLLLMASNYFLIVIKLNKENKNVKNKIKYVVFSI